MQRLKTPALGQSCLSKHSFIYGHFGPRRHLMAGRENRHARAKAFRIWPQETHAQRAAQPYTRSAGAAQTEQARFS